MHGSDYDDDKSDNGPDEVSPQARGRRISKYMNALSSNVKVYILSFFTTAYMYAPIYTLNTCKWVKMAVVDAHSGLVSM